MADQEVYVFDRTSVAEFNRMRQWIRNFRISGAGVNFKNSPTSCYTMVSLAGTPPPANSRTTNVPRPTVEWTKPADSSSS